MSAIPEGYKQTEVGVIPEDWGVRTIRSVSKLINGRGFKPHEWKKSGLPIIRIQNLNGSDDFNYYQGAYDRKLEVDPGQLLFAWSGSRGTSFGPHVWQGVRGLLNYHTWKVQVNESAIDWCFFFHALKKLTEFIEDRAHGASALVHTQKWEMEGFHFPLPASIPEQRAIAAALSDVDALLAKLDQLIAKKRDLKQATMQQLLTGQTRLPGFSGSWEVKRLGDVLIEIGDGATPSTSKPGNFGGTIAWVVIEDIRDDIWSTHNTLTEAGLQSCAAKLWPTGTLILSTGATIGEVGIARIPLATKQGICGLVFDPKKATSGFMKYWFAANKAVLLAKAQGSSIKEVRAPTLVLFEVALPKVTEQTAIATVLSDMDAELAALETRRDKTRALKQGMMQELLTGRIRLL